MTLRRLTRIAAIALVIIGAYWLYAFLSRIPGYPVNRPPLTLANLTHFEIHQYEIGLFLQLTIIPVALLYVLSIVPFFRQALQEQPVPHATLGIFAGLVVVQFLSQSYEIWTSRSVPAPFSVGLVVITIGCLLGGWRIGLALGVMSWLYQGSYEFLAFFPFWADVQNVGLWKAIRELEWGRILFFHYINPHISAGLWASVLACLCTDLLGPRRYSPLAALGLGAGLVFIIGYLYLIAGTPFYLYTLSQALITGLAMGAVMLLIRNLQAETARRKAEAIKLALAQAELRALRAQINPHFLFNALNTIRYMIRADPQVARRLLLNLSEVFQRTLRSGEFVPLRDELSYVQAYLALEKARLDQRLQIRWSIQNQPVDELTNGLTHQPLFDCPVSTLILQPIVENAVIHGISRKSEGGTVGIAIEQIGDDLLIRVQDDGRGMDAARLAEVLQSEQKDNTAIGLRNVDRRLRMLYGEDYGLRIESQSGHGTRVEIRIPIKR